jgi:hypothetical protein
MSKASVHIDELVSYFRFAGGEVRGGSLADIEVLLDGLDSERAAVGKQLLHHLQMENTDRGLLLVAVRRDQVLGAALGYLQDDCYWVNEMVSNGKVRGTGTALMREFAQRAQLAGKELRLQAYREGGSLGFYDALGARTVDHYNKRVLGWKKAALEHLAGQKEIDAITL